MTTYPISCLVVPKGCHEPKNEEIDVWDNEEIQRVIDALDGSPLRLLLVLAVNTGARISELLALTYEDVSDNTMTITDSFSRPRQESFITKERSRAPWKGCIEE